MKRVFHRSIINERNSVFVGHSEVLITNGSGSRSLFYLTDIERAFVVLSRPSDFTSTEQALSHTTANQLIVCIINHHITFLEQGQFLHTLVRQRVEVLLMSASDVGQYANGRTDDALKRFHLSHFRNACLEDTKFCPFVHQPDRQRHTDLRVVASRRTGNDMFGAKELIKPLFHHGLSIATGNTDHGDIKLSAIFLGQALQSLQWVSQLQEIRICKVRQLLRQVAHHEVADSAFV